MPINIGDNFSYLGKKFLDNRESFDTIAEMAQCNEVPNGFITYCKEDKQRYTYQDTNTIDSKLGKWRLFEVGISDDDFANLTENFASKEELHEHTNKSIIDKITSDKITSWDNKSTFNGDYNSLTNKPTIPSIDGLASEEYVEGYVEEKLDEFKDEIHSHDNKDILDDITEKKVNEWDNKSDFSGSYDDLTDKPTIPSIDGLASEEYVEEKINTLELIETSDTEPENEKISIWINSSEDTLIDVLARINDDIVSSNTTWSSKKINDVLNPSSNNNENNINLQMFGVVGDGVVDDTQAIQNAINYGHQCFLETGKTQMIILNDGKYLISSTITIPQSIRIELQGMCYIVCEMQEENIPALHFSFDNSIEFPFGEWIGGSGRLQVVNRRGRDIKQYGVKISGNKLANVYFSNITTRNFYIGLFYDAQNVWCVTFRNCKFFVSTWGFYYGHYVEKAGGVTNSGERICFDGCLFTQNYIDCVYHGTNWGQTNFRNTSFDFSDCVFYIQRDGEIGWNANTIKISCHQCHFEGIGKNLGDNYQDVEIKGILYAINPNSLVVSVTDSAMVVDREFPMFVSYGKSYDVTTDTYVLRDTKANIGTKLILENLMFFPNTLVLAKYPLISKNIDVECRNIMCRMENGYIDGRENKLMKLRPLSPYNCVNYYPFFQNYTNGSYEITKGTDLGLTTLNTVTGLSGVTIEDCDTFVSNGKRIVLDYSYSGKYNTEVQLVGKEFYEVEGGRLLLSQVYTNALSRSYKFSKRVRSEVTDASGTWIIDVYNTDIVGDITIYTKKDITNPTTGTIITEEEFVDYSGKYPSTVTNYSDGSKKETSIFADEQDIKYITITNTSSIGDVTQETRKALYSEIDYRADSGRFITLTIISYDKDKNELSRVYSYPIYPRDSVGEKGLTIANPIQLSRDTKYIGYILTLRNGRVGGVYPKREIEGLFFYTI